MPHQNIVHAGLPGGQITETHFAGYLAKYATKSTEAAGFIARRLTPSDHRCLRARLHA